MFKQFSLKDKTLLFPIIIGVLLVAIVFSILIISLNENKTSVTKNHVPPHLQQVPTPATIGVKTIVPEEPTTLTAGTTQAFQITFNRSISQQDVSFTLTYTDISQDNPEKVVVPLSVVQTSPEAILLKTKEAIQEQGGYDLSIVDNINGTVIASRSYLSGIVLPTKIPANDQTLKQFLPHETSSYILEYNANQNLYIFHFKFDPTNSDDITTQIQDAKNQAIQFIQSKGVNINNIIIDFRSS